MTDPTFPIVKGQPKPRKPKAKKPPSKTYLLNQCDKFFSLIVRSRGRCEACGSTEFLQAAHGFSRSYRSVRFDERQVWALCRGCHVFWTHRPLEWADWMLARMGADLYEEVRVLALTGPNPDLAVLLPVLRERWKHISGEAA